MLTRFRAVTGLSVLACAALVAIITSEPCAQVPPPGTPPASAERVVATIDGDKITEADLDRAVGAEIGRLEQQIYELRKNRLDELIGERLVAREAARRNVPVDDLLKSEVDAKAGAISDDEVTRFFEANKARLPNAPNIRDQIRQYLTMQRTEDAREAFVGTLRANAAVAVTLAKPPIRRAEVLVGSSPVRGDASAPVTIVEFSDFHCPYCRTVQPTLLKLLDAYPGKVRLVYKDLPLDGLHPNARQASEAARCANDQGKFWQFHDVLYSGTVGIDVSAETLTGVATKAGLDLAAFKQCLDGDAHLEGIQRDVDHAGKLGLTGTPAFFVNGRLLTGAQPFEGFAKIIDEELAAGAGAGK
jgi:protein-disulfide isomerase